MTTDPIRLTQYSHGAGCGCKIAPDVLTRILQHDAELDSTATFPNLVVGHQSRDDAAAVKLNEQHVVLSTTDFFMPIVDDPYQFGRIAATNAISDIYAMGGTPIMAIAILGWPVAKLPPEVANRVVQGGRDVCAALGFPLAGGHSIDAPEPIFGLAVTGIASREHLKQNDAAHAGDNLILTKPLGIGIHTTAEKQNRLQPDHAGLATDVMCQANDIGAELATVSGVHAMTDVTGFGLAGHLLEMCQGAGLTAMLDGASLPELEGLDDYIQAGCVPGGSQRNFDAYGEHLAPMDARLRTLVCDPQTSGGLLIAVAPAATPAVQSLLKSHGLVDSVIGELRPAIQSGPIVNVSAA